MRKLCVKLYHATSYPPLGPVFKNIFFFFKNILLPYLKCKTCSKVYIWKVSMRRMKDIFNQGPQFCVKWVDALLFHENGVAIIFTCKMNRNIHRCTFWTNQLWQFSVGSLIIGFSGVFPKLASHLPQWSLLFHYCSQFLPYSLSLGICNYICIFTFQNCLGILTIFFTVCPR
jgi:hypothetical protein